MRSAITGNLFLFVIIAQKKKEFLYKQAIPFFYVLLYNTINKGSVPIFLRRIK